MHCVLSIEALRKHEHGNVAATPRPADVSDKMSCSLVVSGHLWVQDARQDELRALQARLAALQKDLVDRWGALTLAA